MTSKGRKLCLVLNRMEFWSYVNNKINKTTVNNSNYKHILQIMNILFDEMSQDLMNHKKIKVLNFCTFEMRIMKAKMHPNYLVHKMTQCKDNNKIKMTFPPKIRLKLMNHFDVNKSIEQEQSSEVDEEQLIATK